MFTKTDALGFFATYVWVHELDPAVYEPMNERMIAKIDELISPRPALKPRESWQTDQNLQNMEEFQELMSHVRAAAEGVLDFVKVAYEAFEVTGCWANVNPIGAPHMAHTHPNNYLGGVYYARTQPGADKIWFRDPRAQPNIISPKVKETNPYNAGQVSVDVKDGMLILFPAWFEHSVPPNLSDRERISISFNIMFSQFTEAMSRPRWTARIPTKKPEEMESG